MSNFPSEALTSHPLTIMNDWNVKVSHYADQYLVCMFNRYSGDTFVEFFTAERDAIDFILYQIEV